ncbi:hypothetical protein BDR26DRAFT_820254 [Obelidium mucronatum]|nr:hypothetical protein BDR26DRAFT_820254 [Obelidium mucronatum]
MQRVLVSGVSGYIGCHVARELLQKGYAVRGTVRSQQKADQVRLALAPFVQSADSLEFSIVADIGTTGAFDSAVAGVDFVLHTASPFHYSVTDPEKDLIDPAVRGTLGVLESVSKHGKSVKRVVITSSMASIRNSPTTNPAGLSELDWNVMAMGQFTELKEKTPPAVAYSASKAFAEKAAWEFMKKEPRAFDLAVINPPFVFGPIIHPCANIESLNTSVKMVADFYTNTTKEINPLMAAGRVDVRDVAKAHVLAMTEPKASGERFVISSGPFTHQKLIEVLSKKFPGRPYASGVTTGVPVPELNQKAKDNLGMTHYIEFEDSITDTVLGLKEKFGI